MPGLDDLYRDIILDHSRSPRNQGALPSPPAHQSTGYNPLCGDEITVYVNLEGEGDDQVVTEVTFVGQGCSISQSSASMMTNAVMGKTRAEIDALTRRFKSMMSIETDAGADSSVRLGDLQALEGVNQFPVRIKCATLAWNTLAEAIEQS
ncbi:MAG: SUF system NifU family Fe-S cluster assembly protein [Ilumatobacter coccineus]|uniref:SUF system NifU family Fe-S cluster assembly protein n=1 Tax=Ilumatobacter coccineus TaxID=467094 RepID=A0A2G6KEI6_9ACTN|nr:MAG: SUF system NifU family Fe-S cluster assembly protein [Ilumatobacter coccineus]